MSTTGKGGALEPRLAQVLATWFGCGLSPVAPGTVGTLGALPLWFAVRGGGPVAVLGTAVVVTLVGVWSGGVVARSSGIKDPQRVVIDEVAGVLVALAATPPTARGVAAAVLLFRVFDMTKPFPARRAEKLPGGWGIVIDDVVAGFQAAVVVKVAGALGALT
ncbi:MAG TPA: phosphatidylglycerophosphatase A [Labilithrix sp.]|jgi:phosphatidylglycerophosphatase A|nr:phosphatidylglycerophosphatase A [Labilithrix sp.]